MPRLWYEIMWFLFLHIRIITEGPFKYSWKLKIETEN